jgi:transcriptional regulator with XRE-family HTH domain
MKLEADRVRALARERGWTVSELLGRAGVSRTAYYSLVRRPTVLPGTVHALADALEVRPAELLRDGLAEAREAARARIAEARRICAQNPDADFDNVRHTLTLLDLPPVERLNASLRRGRPAAVHR